MIETKFAILEGKSPKPTPLDEFESQVIASTESVRHGAKGETIARELREGAKIALDEVLMVFHLRDRKLQEK